MSHPELSQSESSARSSTELADTLDQEMADMVADALTYGVDKLWVVLESIPIELEEESDYDSNPPGSSEDTSDSD